MDPVQFFAASRLLVVAGKGGVGKTTVTAALARAAAGLGLRVLVVELEPLSGLGGMLGPGVELGYDDASVAEGTGPEGQGWLRARLVTPSQALLDYLDDKGLRRLSNRMVRHGVLDIVATAAPGIDDLLVLGKVKQLERTDVADLIVLDAPAAGHAVRFLQAASGLLDAVTVGPIHTQARDVLEMLDDPARCQVVLVTLPEETPVNELVDTAYTLEDRVGVHLGPVIVNGLYPEVPGLEGVPDDAPDPLVDAAAFRRDRLALQHEQLERLSARLPLPQLRLPFLFTAGVGPAEVALLADQLLVEVGALAA